MTVEVLALALSCNYSGTPLAPPSAATEKEEEFVVPIPPRPGMGTAVPPHPLLSNYVIFPLTPEKISHKRTLPERINWHNEGEEYFYGVPLPFSKYHN